MRSLVALLSERVGLDRADLLGVAVALVGCVVATVVALRVPLLAVVADGGADEGGVAVVAADPDSLDADVYVHVAGAVVSPGLVQVPAGSRVADALGAAGGTTPDAVLDALNLARVLSDGEQVVVPTGRADTEHDGSGDTGLPEGRLADGRVDLNSADVAVLEELPGVGPVLAARIVAHREEHGPFTAAASLREVSGIGEATWIRLRDLVGVR